MYTDDTNISTTGNNLTEIICLSQQRPRVNQRMAYRKQTKLKDAIIGELDELKCIINKKIADLEKLG